MWPWGHVAVAYLCYSILARGRYERPPLAVPAIVVVLASQGPDLIDKPLAWSLDVLPGGRTLGHSVFFVAVLLTVVAALAVRFERGDLGLAFAVGYVSHLLADVPPSTVSDPAELTFLFWPILEPTEYESVGGILEAFLGYSMGVYEWAQLGLFVVAAIVWFRDGMPGWSVLWGRVDRAVAFGR